MSVTKLDKELIEGKLRITVGLGLLVGGISNVLAAKYPDKKLQVNGCALALGVVIGVGAHQLDKRIISR